VSPALGHSANQRRVLAELGLSPMRPRSCAGKSANHTLVLRAANDDALLAMILAWMPDGAVRQAGGEVRLDLPGDDDLAGPLDMASLRRRPDWKRQLWWRQRRLRRGSGR